MRKFQAVIPVFILFSLFAAAPYASCQDIKASRIVDEYVKETDLQKGALVKGYIGKTISVSGTVADVGEEDTFDVVNDIKRKYYKVVTEVEKTPCHNPYRAILIYKDKSRTENINKGQKIALNGNIIRIMDEKLYLSVWISKDELTAEERSLFK